MGGFGSGNTSTRWEKKTVVEDCKSIDANRWMREGILKASVHHIGSWRWTYRNGGGFSVYYEVDTREPAFAFVRLWYSWIWRSTQKQESAEYRVCVTTTRLHHGGLRWWFICPLIVGGRPCGRRVGKLYLPPQGRYFGCRRCNDLTYTSCQESRKYDRLYRAMARDMGEDIHTVKRIMGRLGKSRLDP